MPIEIKELHVRVQVTDDRRSTQRESPGSGREHNDRLIQACVEEVLEILRRKEQR